MNTAPPPAPLVYEGLVTRAIAFAVDAANIDLIALLVGVGLGLPLSILTISDSLRTVLLACGAVFTESPAADPPEDA